MGDSVTGERQAVAGIVGGIVRNPHRCKTDRKYDQQTEQERGASLRQDGCGRCYLQRLMAGNSCCHRLILSMPALKPVNRSNLSPG